MKARIVREDGSDADYHEIGELWLNGDNVAMGYWDNERATQEAFVVFEGERWVKTGDHFKCDRDGFFWFEDRGKVRWCNRMVEDVVLTFMDDATLGYPQGLGHTSLPCRDRKHAPKPPIASHPRRCSRGNNSTPKTLCRSHVDSRKPGCKSTESLGRFIAQWREAGKTKDSLGAGAVDTQRSQSVQVAERRD